MAQRIEIDSIQVCECCNSHIAILVDGEELDLGKTLRCQKCGRFFTLNDHLSHSGEPACKFCSKEERKWWRF